MTQIPKTIYMIPQSQFKAGLCGICHEPALLKFRDTDTGFIIGDCCLAHLTAAKSEIQQSAHRFLHGFI
jgi:hypothetical protein